MSKRSAAAAGFGDSTLDGSDDEQELTSLLLAYNKHVGTRSQLKDLQARVDALEAEKNQMEASLAEERSRHRQELTQITAATQQTMRLLEGQLQNCREELRKGADTAQELQITIDALRVDVHDAEERAHDAEERDRAALRDAADLRLRVADAETQRIKAGSDVATANFERADIQNRFSSFQTQAQDTHAALQAQLTFERNRADQAQAREADLARIVSKFVVEVTGHDTVARQIESNAE
jgi:chromosome segregation ATPase